MRLEHLLVEAAATAKTSSNPSLKEQTQKRKNGGRNRTNRESMGASHESPEAATREYRDPELEQYEVASPHTDADGKSAEGTGSGTPPQATRRSKHGASGTGSSRYPCCRLS